ncbi:hypothetical protein C2R22_23500 (plasmid) [Salinigranum rubrum]|uniref:Uncharacterized protein n=1 Tax=Salinigranum rubrum TaxID=755307 RepID=A0A2I8VRH3_9EURY|nr:hypothetical protein [Salinigranum rubrum]AUV84512.1 hypothetical protein C2R22_23500 [Salinigranum rubrum]
MVGVLFVCFLQQCVKVAVGRRRDTLLVSLFERFVVWEGLADRRWKGPDGLTREGIERNDAKNIVPLQADTFLFLAGFINDDEAPVVGSDVDRPVDAAATAREIPDASRETDDASSKRRQELSPLYCRRHDSAIMAPRG